MSKTQLWNIIGLAPLLILLAPLALEAGLTPAQFLCGAGMLICAVGYASGVTVPAPQTDGLIATRMLSLSVLLIPLLVG